MEADPETEAYINDINTEFEGILNEVVAETDVALVVNDPATADQEEPVRLVRTCETNLGGLCADAYRAVTGADIGFCNGGDGFNMFQNCNMPLEDIMLDNQALIQYITEDLSGTVGEQYISSAKAEFPVLLSDRRAAHLMPRFPSPGRIRHSIILKSHFFIHFYFGVQTGEKNLCLSSLFLYGKIAPHQF